MKNERGFFTVVGLCLLLTAAILIQGVQEFEANYSRGAKNSLIEFELQNAAESALLAAKDNPELTSMNVASMHAGNITVQIESKTDNIHFKTDGDVTKELDLNSKSGKIFIAVASCEANFMEGKIYRRALAYVINGDDTVHFVNDL